MVLNVCVRYLYISTSRIRWETSVYGSLLKQLIFIAENIVFWRQKFIDKKWSIYKLSIPEPNPTNIYIE